MVQIISKPFDFKSEDFRRWGKRTVQTLAPYLVVIIPVAIEQLPKDWAYAAVVIWVMQRVLDLLRRYVTTTYK